MVFNRMKRLWRWQRHFSRKDRDNVKITLTREKQQQFGGTSYVLHLEAAIQKQC